MPPLISRRAASVPTIVSLSKLLHVIPAIFKSQPVKRSGELVLSASTLSSGGKGGDQEGDPKIMVMGLLCIGLVLLGGVFAGLTLALMGSDDLNLRVLAASSDDPKERRDAGKVLRLLNRGRHWVLVVLLLANVIVNESLPIFLHDVFGDGFSAVIVSTIMIVIFGEVIPQAICVRYGLAIGGACAPLVHFMMVIFAPVAWPLAKLLDWLLGHDSGHTYKKAELKSFLQFHREGEEPLRDDEITILNGVLSLNDRHVKEIMTPLQDCLVLPADKVLDHETVDHILISGFSRIPIHEPGQPDNFIGMLLVKRLITYNPEDELPVNKFTLNSLPEAAPDLNCFQALDYFQTGRAHLLLISETPGRRGGGLGIISLEDLIEEIIGEEIIDETDRYQDNHSKRKAQRRATQEIMRGIIERQRVINAFSRRPSNQGNHSRNQSPNPGPREGVLVNLTDSVNHAEPESFGSPLKKEVKLDGENVTIITTAPNGDQAKIVELPAAQEGDSVMEGDDDTPAGEHNERQNSNDSDKTAKPSTTDSANKAEAADDDSSPDTPTTASDAASSNTDAKKTNGNSKRRKGKVSEQALREPFPTFEEFKAAALAFIAKYGERRTLEPGPARTNAGWEWRSVQSKWRGEQGYMSRRVVLPVAPSTSTTAEMEEEEEDDPAAVAPRATERIEGELSVVYSPSYRVPALSVRAWDAQGVPLPLGDIVRYFLRAADGHDHDGREDAVMLPGAAFPLLQAGEHAVTGQGVWSVHPCEVRGAVAEIVRENTENTEEMGVRWLEAWFMLSDSVVVLTQ